MAGRTMAGRTMAEPVTYSGYLRLDQLLSAQQPRSGEHDEMLFIVIHQVYELWFKQLRHEFGKLQAELESGGGTHAPRTLRRTLAIMKIVVAQLDVLETMTPTQFTRFRDWLGTSSGFESATSPARGTASQRISRTGMSASRCRLRMRCSRC
jgi:tryptophan 2,3-dioxygenase